MKDKRKLLFLVSCFTVLCISFSVYLIACFPGVMTTDSLYQWREFVTGKYYDWHPVAYTLFMYLCTRVWYSPAAVAIAQIIILAVTFTYGMGVLIKTGISKKILFAAAILFALYPVNGFMITVLWKDIIYSIMLLWMTILLINIVNTECTWISSSLNKAAFIICSLGVLFFRYNGILTIGCIILILAFVYKKYVKTIMIIGIGLATTYFIAIGPVSSMAGVVKIPNAETLGIPMQQVAAVIYYHGDMTEEQKDFFDKVLPLQNWREKYNPYSANPIKFDKKFNTDFVIKHKPEFLKQWLSVVVHNPLITAKAYLKQTLIIWNVIPFRDSYVHTTSLSIDNNEFGLHPININNNIRSIIHIIFHITIFDNLQILFWRPALWLYASIAAGIVLAVKLKKKMLILLVPVVSNALAYMAAVPDQDFRYQYANVLAAFILIPLAIHACMRMKNSNI